MCRGTPTTCDRDMKLSINSVSARNVYRTTEGDTEYLVAEDVTIGKPLFLDGGYVPAEEWERTGSDWSGVPLPVGHPLDRSGEPVAVSKNDDVEAETSAGHLRDASHDPDDDSVSGDLWIDVDRAESLGHYGRRVIERLENGEALEVSSTYLFDDGEPGVYDGEHREQVSVNISPDSVALLPDDLGPGRCSRDEGCGVPPEAGGDADAESAAPSPESPPTPGSYGVAANAAGPIAGPCLDIESGTTPDATVATDEPVATDGGKVAANASEGDIVRWVASDGESVRYGIVVDTLDDSDRQLVAVYEYAPDEADPENAGGENWMSSGSNARVSPDSLETIEQFPAEPADPENVAANTATADTVPPDADDDVGLLARVFRRAFPGLADTSDPFDDPTDDAETSDERPDSRAGSTDTTDMDREQAINTLVSEYDYDRASLTGMGDTCLQRTLAVNSEADADDGDDPDSTDPEPADDTDSEDDPDANPESDDDNDDSDDSEDDAPGDEDSAGEMDLDDVVERLDRLESENTDLRETVTEREEKIDQLEEIIDERETQEQTRHEVLNEQIRDLTDVYSDEDLDDMSESQKVSTIRALSGGDPEVAANARSGTDYGGLGSPSPDMNVSANTDDDDDEGGTKHGGALGNALRGEGDD